jgi:hypothetical protein
LKSTRTQGILAALSLCCCVAATGIGCSKQPPESSPEPTAMIDMLKVNREMTVAVVNVAGETYEQALQATVRNTVDLKVNNKSVRAFRYPTRFDAAHGVSDFNSDDFRFAMATGAKNPAQYIGAVIAGCWVFHESSRKVEAALMDSLQELSPTRSGTDWAPQGE